MCRTGDFRNRIEDAVIAGSGITAEEVVWQLVLLNCAEDPESVSWPNHMSGLWILQKDPARTIYQGGKQ